MLDFKVLSSFDNGVVVVPHSINRNGYRDILMTVACSQTAALGCAQGVSSVIVSAISYTDLSKSRFHSLVRLMYSLHHLYWLVFCLEISVM